jgi:hypothetical protein
MPFELAPIEYCSGRRVQRVYNAVNRFARNEVITTDDAAREMIEDGLSLKGLLEE